MKKTCSFFGHRKIEITEELKSRFLKNSQKQRDYSRIRKSNKSTSGKARI